MKTRKQKALEKIKLWRKRPDIFFEEALGVTTLEGYQRDLALTIAENTRTTVRASHSLGKTWEVARIALWFYSCFTNSIIITTAPTFTQVETLLWGELREAFKKSKYKIDGSLLNTKLKLSDKWYAMGLSPQKSAGSAEEQLGSTFQGFHSDYVMVLFDEATGVVPDIWKMSDGLLTSGKIVKFVAIANPTTRACEFFKTFSSPRYAKVHLNCFDSPNMKANGFISVECIQDEIDRLMSLDEGERLKQIQEYKKPVPHLVSAQWVIEYCLEWGIDHPLVISKAFGNFPDEDDSALIKMADVENSMKRSVVYDSSELRCIGIDVARFGDDKSVIIEMVGKKQVGLEVGVKQSVTHITGLAVQMITNERFMTNTIVLVDATGIGAGVFDNLLEKQNDGIIDKHVDLREIHFGASPETRDETDKEKVAQDKARFFNLKSRMFHLLADDLKYHLDLFDDSNFLKELPTIKYNLDTKGRLRIESKDDYRKRTGRKSPDYSDALALCNYGRYVTITYGSFKNRYNDSSKPLIKQKKIKPRKPCVKVSEY